MQPLKPLFSNPNYFGTQANIQKCLRLNDLNEIGDGTHYLSFEMIGLFSFRQWTVPQGINFFMTFLKRLNLKPGYVTIHPDKIDEWSHYYEEFNIPIKRDKECIWSDGNIRGYCTEFYINGIEIGNIVNPLGDCLDIGFGLERLIQVSGGFKPSTKREILEETCQLLINSGIKPGNNKQGYILKKLIIECLLCGSKNNTSIFNEYRKKLQNSYNRYLGNKDKPKYKDKTPEFWLDTFGVDITRLTQYKSLL